MQMCPTLKWATRKSINVSCFDMKAKIIQGICWFRPFFNSIETSAHNSESELSVKEVVANFFVSFVLAPILFWCSNIVT